MAIKINNTTVIDNNKRAELGIVNFGSYTQEELQNLVVTGTSTDDFVYNSTKQRIVFWTGEDWGGGEITVSGANVVEDSTHTYYVFLSPGSFTITGELTECEALLVAGGGGGGSGYYGGGGGAGGIVYVNQSYGWQQGQYNVAIGDRGARGTGYQPGGKGGDSSVISVPISFTLTAKGGGGGGGRNAKATPGGSGGGTGLPTGDTTGIQPTITQSITPEYFTQFGTSGYSQAYGSGGGGSASPGNPGPGTYRPNPSGGDGQTFLSFPVPTIADAIPAPNRSAWVSAVGAGTFGGGGGGGAYPAPRAYLGGAGGGGQGGQPGIPVTDGVSFTGGGGGGAYGAGATAAYGGTGIFLLKVPK